MLAALEKEKDDNEERRCSEKSWLMKLRADYYVIDMQKLSCIGCMSDIDDYLDR